MQQRTRSKHKNTRYHAKPRALRLLELARARGPNKIPVVKQIRAFKARKSALKRRIVGNAARLATLGYIKPLSHTKLKPCKGVRAALKRAYFGYKAVKNLPRGGNRAKDKRSKKVAKSRFTVLNCR